MNSIITINEIKYILINSNTIVSRIQQMSHTFCEICHEISSVGHDTQCPYILYPDSIYSSVNEWELLESPGGSLASTEGSLDKSEINNEILTPDRLCSPCSHEINNESLIPSPTEEFIPVSYYDEDYSDDEFIIDVDGQRYFDTPNVAEEETTIHTPIVRETQSDNVSGQVVSDALATNNINEWRCLVNDVMFVPQGRCESIIRSFSELHLKGVYDFYLASSLSSIEDIIQHIDITPIEMNRLIEFIDVGRPRNELYYVMNKFLLSHYFDALLLLEDPIIDIKDIREMTVIEMDEVITSLNMRPREGRRFKRIMFE